MGKRSSEYCTNSINSSHLVTCGTDAAKFWFRRVAGDGVTTRKNSSKCQNAGGRHRVLPLSVDSLKYFIELLNS